MRSVGDIAKKFETTIGRVQYAIRSRQIKPTLTAGNRHLYDDDLVDSIGELLEVTAINYRGRVRAGDQA